ncbi:hypothetical protein EYF80_053549 [Liparis tanakae]|uniref:Uncharacterized protein n=1 Tax=Liparis tanakae TaxID=230148 RepID=A0A4Z2F7I4_9TELE|nr:hypothetical protein EYF80_053549 [Liparis tanakae]
MRVSSGRSRRHRGRHDEREPGAGDLLLRTPCSGNQPSTPELGVANPVGVASSSSPALRDGGGVRPRADVLHDVGVLLAAEVPRRVVGLTHGEEERRGRARGELQHVGHERRGTQAEGVHAWGHRTPRQGLFRVKRVVPTKRTALRMKELKLQPAALMLASAPPPPPLRLRDTQQNKMASPIMIWGHDTQRHTPFYLPHLLPLCNGPHIPACTGGDEEMTI